MFLATAGLFITSKTVLPSQKHGGRLRQRGCRPPSPRAEAPRAPHHTERGGRVAQANREPRQGKPRVWGGSSSSGPHEPRSSQADACPRALVWLGGFSLVPATKRVLSRGCITERPPPPSLALTRPMLCTIRQTLRHEKRKCCFLRVRRQGWVPLGKGQNRQPDQCPSIRRPCPNPETQPGKQLRRGGI